jgi:hypothetical protein
VTRGARVPEVTTEGRPLTKGERIRLFPPIHSAVFALRWVGLRGRLHCPQCRAVGTWKPHGTIACRIFRKDRPVRRYLCKWCGYYTGPEGAIRTFPDMERGAWALPRPWDPEAPEKPGPTPADAVEEILGKAWPWAG